MTPGRTRQQRYRERLRQAGKQRVELWLDGEDLARLETFRQSGERWEAMILRILDAWPGVTGNGPSPTGERQRDTVTGDTLLLAFIQLFFPEGKPVYPRRSYGLRTLPPGRPECVPGPPRLCATSHEGPQCRLVCDLYRPPWRDRGVWPL